MSFTFSNVDLQDNQLSGALPIELGKLRQLEELVLHGNALSGAVPAASLAKLTRLHLLTLGGELGGNENLTISRRGASVLTGALPEAQIYLPGVIADEPPPGDADEKKLRLPNSARELRL